MDKGIKGAITSVLWGAAVGAGISHLAIIELYYIDIIGDFCALLYKLLGISIGDSFLLVCPFVAGIICFILHLTASTIIKRKLGAKILGNLFDISLMVSVFLYAVGSALYWEKRGEFGFFVFAYIISIWFVVASCYGLYALVKDMRKP